MNAHFARTLPYLLLATAAVAASGCGVAVTRGRSASTSSTGSVGYSEIYGGGVLAGSGYSVSTPVGSSTSATGTGTSTGSTALTFRVGAIGYTSTTVTVNVNKVLKVQFTPGQQDETVSGTSNMPYYSGLGVYIAANSGTPQPTPFLRNGYLGSTVQSSPVMDFSSQIGNTCATHDSGCRTPVTITISKPNYDFYCLYYGINCPWAHVAAGHPWHGTLTVQTDDTDAIAQ